MSLLLAMMVAMAHPAPALPHADPVAVASIKQGKHDCPHCDLAGADLNNTCVKAGNLEGADFEGANLSLMCMSYADFKDANFRGADLGAANLAHANLAGADFTGADLTITSFKGTDLTKAVGLTQTQLDQACGDKETKPPAGMRVPICN